MATSAYESSLIIDLIATTGVHMQSSMKRLAARLALAFSLLAALGPASAQPAAQTSANDSETLETLKLAYRWGYRTTRPPVPP